MPTDINYNINLLKLGFDIISINKINKLIVKEINVDNINGRNNDTTINEDIINIKYNSQELNNNNNNNNNNNTIIEDDLENCNVKYDSPEIMRCNDEFSQLNLSGSFYNNNNNNNNNNNKRLSVSIAFNNHCIDQFSPIINSESVIFDNNEYNHIDSLNSNVSSFQDDNIQELIYNCNNSNDLSQEYITQKIDDNNKEKSNDYNIIDPISEYDDTYSDNNNNNNNDDDNYEDNNSQISINSDSNDSDFPVISKIGMLKYCNKDINTTTSHITNNNNNNNRSINNLTNLNNKLKYLVPTKENKNVPNKKWDQYFSSHITLDESIIDDDLIINSNKIDNNYNSSTSPIWIRQQLNLTNKSLNNKKKNKKICNTKAYNDVINWIHEVNILNIIKSLPIIFL
jgi:hypothetical protein